MNERTCVQSSSSWSPSGGCSTDHGATGRFNRVHSPEPRAFAIQAASGVRNVLHSAGEPFDLPERFVLERSFGHDFSEVRIHNDFPAARSAAEVGARAYTVGNHIVFGPGAYSPESAEGRALLGHELAHVVQQSGSAEIADLSGKEDPALEADAQRAGERVATGQSFAFHRVPTERSLQRQTDPRRFDLVPDLRSNVPREFAGPPPLLRPGDLPETIILPAPPEVRLEEPRMLRPQVPLLLGDPSLRLSANLPAPVTIIPVPRCVPETPLTWANFRGSPPGGSFGARTTAPVILLDIQGNPMFQARLNESASGVRAKFANPADRRVNGCASPVARCQRDIQRGLIDWHFTGGSSAVCPASIVASSIPTANTSAECDTVIGAECDRAAQLESERLLRHEQGHFDISCMIANKANDALRAGSALDPVRRAVNAKLQATQNQYDRETAHGCNAGQQAAWEAAIRSQLPSVSIP